jgi:single-strand DNA-binding protein
MLPNITIEGRAVNDPELRFTTSGQAVANFRVAASESKKLDDGTWEDGDKIFVNVAVWKEAGEAVAEHVRKGDKVVVTGRLYEREYETSAGEKRRSLEVKFANVAKVVSAPRTARQTSPASAAPIDPWATPASDDNPPF